MEKEYTLGSQQRSWVGVHASLGSRVLPDRQNPWAPDFTQAHLLGHVILIVARPSRAAGFPHLPCCFPRTGGLGSGNTSLAAAWLVGVLSPTLAPLGHVTLLCQSYYCYVFNRGKKRRFYVSFLVPSQWEWNFLWSLKFGGYCPITYRNYRQDSILLPSTCAVGTVSAHNVAPALILGRTAPARLCKWLPQTPWSTKEVTGGIRAAVKGLCLRIYSEGGRTLCNWMIIQSGWGFLWLPGNNSPVELRNPDMQTYQEPGQAAPFSLLLCFLGPSFCCHRAPVEADGTGHGIRGAQRALCSAPPRRLVEVGSRMTSAGLSLCFLPQGFLCTWSWKPNANSLPLLHFPRHY